MRKCKKEREIKSKKYSVNTTIGAEHYDYPLGQKESVAGNSVVIARLLVIVILAKPTLPAILINEVDITDITDLAEIKNRLGLLYQKKERRNLMDSKILNPNFYVQWHITDECSQRCKHCYLFQSQNNNLPLTEKLDINVLSLIVKDIFKTAEALKANAVFVLTGGDPILHPDFWRLLEIINIGSKKFRFKTAIDILGNPVYINNDSASMLRKHGIRKYQLSLDGLEEKHDYLRKRGSYQATISAARILKKNGISPTCMFTLSKFNAPDLVSVIKEVASGLFDAFAFARFCRPDNLSLEEYRAQMFTPLEYKNLLTEIYKTYQKLAKSYPNFRFVFKDHLWELFFYERYSGQQISELRNVQRDKIVLGGCSLGVASLSILSDGTVYACRRFTSPVGKVPDQKLIDIFLNSKQLNHYRNLKLHKKCKNCPLLYTCRGCGAMAYGNSGSFFDPDPQCWYSKNKK